ncbi:hypothetical protein ACHAW6_008158 [Cyclotella cf. meneghiniana]
MPLAPMGCAMQIMSNLCREKHSVNIQQTGAHRQQREQANPVLNFNTGEMLEYRQFLRHPKYREIWNCAAVNEFGQLAQGTGGRVKGTDTI